MTHEKEDHEPRLEFGGAFGPGPRETVADLLSRARREIGQDLRGVADVLRIRPAYLEAIESGQFDRLPGATYAVGFLRTYAEYLGLDGEEIVERFKAETQAAERRSELIFPEPLTEGRVPGGAIILVSVALLGIAYGAWFYFSQEGRTVADLTPAWPESTQTATPADAQTPSNAAPAETGEAAVGGTKDPGIVPAASAQASSAETETAETVAAATPPPLQANETPRAVLSSDSATPVEPAAASTANSPPMYARGPTSRAPDVASAESADAGAMAAAPGVTDMTALVDQTVHIPTPPSTPETIIIPDDRSPRVYGGDSDDSRIVIRALQDSWVQVRDAQEAILLTRVLRTGDSYRVPGTSGLTLLTGNAGGIEIEVDGVRLPPVGPTGAVRRSIALDPAQLLAGASASQ